MPVSDRIGITGAGSALGEVERGNDDPVFAYLKANPPPNQDLFAGLKFRRALGPEQDVVQLGVEAGQMALDRAGVASAEIDMLLGAASIGEYFAPNALAAVHAALGLPPTCRVLALNTQYTEFLDGLKLANDLIAQGSIGRALVVTAIDWTRHMDYHEAVCVAASDAAGAAVVARTSDATRFALLDWENQSDTSLYGALRMAPRALAVPPHYAQQGVFSPPLMKLDDVRGAAAVKSFGLPFPPEIVARLLQRNGLTSDQIALIAHQTSKPVADYWLKQIQPGRFVGSLTELADMVSASVAVNLARGYEEIDRDYLVLLGIGMEMRATAVLYARISA